MVKKDDRAGNGRQLNGPLARKITEEIHCKWKPFVNFSQEMRKKNIFFNFPFSLLGKMDILL